jgi:hypothetical protein
MNPDLEKYIPEIIEIHKKGIAHRLDWSSMQPMWNNLNRGEQRNLKLGMIEMDIIATDPSGNDTYTLLKKYDFNLETYKADKQLEKEKKWYDSANAKIQFENYPIVQRQAKVSIVLAIIAIFVSIVAILVGLWSK